MSFVFPPLKQQNLDIVTILILNMSTFNQTLHFSWTLSNHESHKHLDENSMLCNERWHHQSNHTPVQSLPTRRHLSKNGHPAARGGWQTRNQPFEYHKRKWLLNFSAKAEDKGQGCNNVSLASKSFTKLQFNLRLKSDNLDSVRMSLTHCPNCLYCTYI